MNKMCVAFLGVLLLALHLSTEVVRAQNTTAMPMMNMTMNYTMMPTGMMNTTNDAKNDCARTSTLALLLLLPALGASLLHSWS